MLFPARGSSRQMTVRLYSGALLFSGTYRFAIPLMLKTKCETVRRIWRNPNYPDPPPKKLAQIADKLRGRYWIWRRIEY